MRNIIIIMKKQFRDTLKNKTVLIQFILFPVMTVIMENVVHMEGMPEHFFTKLFSVMYVGMAPLISTAAIIAEEKEKNTLRVLTMANVKPVEYLIGIGSYIWILCMFGSGIMGAVAGFSGTELMTYETVMGIGIFLSVLLGAAIGMFSHNQMMATSLGMPVMMIFSFVPMLSMFNKKIEIFACMLYTEQMHKIFDDMSYTGTDMKGYLFAFVNMALFMVLFLVAFQKKEFE